MSVVAQIRRRRADLGRSQAEVARWAGLKQSEVSVIERGKQDPRVTRAERIARAVDAELMLIPKEKLAAVQRLLSGSAGRPVGYGEPYSRSLVVPDDD